MSMLKNTLIDFDPEIAPEAAPAAPELAAPAAPAAAPSGWLPETREELQQLVSQSAAEASRAALAEFAQSVEPYEQPGAAPNDPYAGYDPFDPATVDAIVEARLEQRFAEVLGPFAERVLPVVNRIESSRAEEAARSAMTSLESEVGGSFDHDHAAARASVLVQSGVPVQDAMRQAATEVRQYEQELVRHAFEQQGVQFENLAAGVTQQPPAGQSAGAEVIPIPTGNDRYRKQLEISKRTHGMTPMVSPTG